MFNGKLYWEAHTIGWLNHLFGTTYTNQRAADPWHLHCILHEYENKSYEGDDRIRPNWNIDGIIQEVPDSCFDFRSYAIHRYVCNLSSFETSEEEALAAGGIQRFSSAAALHWLRRYRDTEDGTTREENWPS